MSQKETLMPTTIPTIQAPEGYKQMRFYPKDAAVLIVGFPAFKEPTKGVVAVYSTPESTVIPVKVKDDNLFIHPNYLFVQDYSYVKPKPLFTEFAEASDDMKFMADLLYATNMDDVITLGLKDVDLTNYDMVASGVGSRWAAIIPKDAKGPMPVLMAHCDIQASVKHPTPENLTYDPINKTFNSPRGLGADDRAGIYTINKALLAHPGKFIVVFLDEEEVGCRGSKNFVTHDAFKDIVDPKASIYISIDRTRERDGSKTVATYNYNNQEVLDLFKAKLDRKSVSGTSTDCRVLSEASYKLSLPGTRGVSCVNFSCGYQYEHTANETLYWEELQICVKDVTDMVEKMPELWTKKFLEDAPKTYGTYGSSNYPYSNPKGHKAGKTKGKQEPKSKYPNSVYDDYIEVNNEYYTSDDIKELLQAYHYLTGKSFNAAVKDPALYIPTRSDYVQLSDDVVVGSIIGGKKMRKDVFIMLEANTWVVHSVNMLTMTAHLKTEGYELDAVEIPFAALKPIKQSDMLITANEGE